MVMVSCAASVMMALPWPSSRVAASRAVMFAKIDWLIWMVSAAGVKFGIVIWPKFGAKTNGSWLTVTEWSDGLVPGAWLEVSLDVSPGDFDWPDVGGSYTMVPPLPSSANL